MYDSFNKINYYALNVKDQKIVWQLLVLAQSPQLLYCGLLPLNLDTFVNVSYLELDDTWDIFLINIRLILQLLKNVYTFAMILIETVN